MQNSTNPAKTLGEASTQQRVDGAMVEARAVTRLIGQFFRGVVDEAVSRTRTALANLRRSGAGRRRLRVVESLALGGRRQLLLVMCDEQEYLVGTGTDSVETIVLRQPDSPAGALKSSASPSGAARDGSGVSTRGNMTQRGNARIGEHIDLHHSARDDRASRLWLVSPAVPEVRENRIREADDGKGQKLWR